MSEQQSDREFLTSERIPAAVGPYSPAVRCGGFIFCSGQLGIDPRSGELAEGLEAQARQALANLAALLEDAGGGLGEVVKTTVYVQNLADFPVLNAIYAEALGSNRPARSTVEVAALPLGAVVEIEAIACVPHGR
jgi:2-iminobutanoate/2-iminopropanoate deaminase